MRQIIFRRICQILLLTLISTLSLTMLLYYQFFFRQMQEELRHEARYIFHNIDDDSAAFLKFLQAMPQETRLTLIAPDGNVLFDNAVPAPELENHATRPEIQSALLYGEGENIRLSSTLDIQTFYYARRLADGSVIRLARSTGSIVQLISETLPPLILMAALIALVALLFTRRIVRKIIEPINSLNLEQPLANTAIYDELSPLIRRLARQQQEINEQFHNIEAQKNEFNSIIENITEGLIVINSKMQILSINNSARRIFAGNTLDYNGCSLLRLSHNIELKETAAKALSAGRQETTLTIGDRTYQIIASPVYKKSQTKGAFLIFIDITEQHFAATLRREFSANVSHELKTPLTSISGFAELLQNSLVKPPDIPGFAARIHDEATRMLTLINDIIKISKLDEKSPQFISEPLHLNNIIQETITRLYPIAKQKNVTLHFSKQPLTPLYGVRTLIDELVYNLLENAIKYNQPGGRVTITACNEANLITLTVADTGIGIPAEHHARIFERFYRVDKSRSRKMGGTGLGLSIVKHIADYHHAKIALTSTESIGTTITINFPVDEEKTNNR